MDNKVIYKVCSRDMWDAATKAGVFEGAAIDLTDGFIHFSAANQVVETVAKHFNGQSDLVLVSVATERLGDKLKWEESRGGDLFPHLYDVLPVSAATRVDELRLAPDGSHQFPEDLPIKSS